MNRRLVLTVTAEDIATGVARDSEFCPIANAASRRFPDYYWVEVAGEGMTAGGLDWVATERTAQFIERFDEGRAVQPGRYVFFLSDDTRRIE